MERKHIEEIMACLPRGRTKFYYFKDRYALMLLAACIGQGMTVGDIKKSRFRRLLGRPVVQEILKNNGHGVLTPGELQSCWPDLCHCYLLTLGIWGDRKHWARYYYQTSRPGWNLVLQLNFSAQHNSSYEKLIRPQAPQPFQTSSHPVARAGYLTLAWARIDLDLDRDEALIEEIQTDWIRLALRSRRDYARYLGSGKGENRYLPRYLKGLGCDLEELSRYIEETLQPHMAIWQEAMLAAAIWFLKDEIGIAKIFYHTFEFGCRLKGISGTRPPRSLYTRLPARFCFEITDQGPDFLATGKNRKANRLPKGEKGPFYLLAV